MGKPARGFSLRQASPRWWVTLAVLVGGSVWLYLRPPDTPSPVILEGPTMGTRYRVVVNDPPVDEAQISDAVQARLDRVVALMSTYEPDSELSVFNRSRSASAAKIARETREVLEIALDVWRSSEGAFDVTVGPLVDRWGFGPDGRPESIPSEEELRALRARVGSEGLQLTEAGLAKRNPETRVDLSAVAKGYGVDLVADALDQMGARSYLIEVGGEIRVRGRKPGGDAYRVAIETPDPTTRDVYAVVDLQDAALATSGNYRNFFVKDGVKYVHALDPKTGRPVEHRLLSASVMHSSCARADAWATALMVAGERAWELAKANDLEVLLLYSASDGALEERVTSGLKAARARAEVEDGS